MIGPLSTLISAYSPAVPAADAGAQPRANRADAQNEPVAPGVVVNLSPAARLANADPINKLSATLMQLEIDVNGRHTDRGVPVTQLHDRLKRIMKDFNRYEAELQQKQSMNPSLDVEATFKQFRQTGKALAMEIAREMDGMERVNAPVRQPDAPRVAPQGIDFEMLRREVEVDRSTGETYSKAMDELQSLAEKLDSAKHTLAALQSDSLVKLGGFLKDAMSFWSGGFLQGQGKIVDDCQCALAGLVGDAQMGKV